MAGPSEVTEAIVLPGQSILVDGGVGQTQPTTGTTTVMTSPTQVRRPWRSMVRTIFQVGLALATLIPLVAASIYEDADAAPAAVVQVLTIAGIVTRVMALPSVEKFLQDWAPWLATSPPAVTRAQRKALNDDQ